MMRRLEGDEHLGRAKPHQTSARRSSVARSIGQQPGVIPSIRVTTQLDPYPNHENAAGCLSESTSGRIDQRDRTSRGVERRPAVQELQAKVPDVPEPPLSHSRMSGPDQRLPSLRGRVTVPSANAVAAAASCTAVALPVGSCTGAWYCT
jgi:hypothetical protein